MTSADPAQSYIINKLLLLESQQEQAHAYLDGRSVPRTDRFDSPLALAGRIAMLIGEVQRKAPHTPPTPTPLSTEEVTLPDADPDAAMPPGDPDEPSAEDDYVPPDHRYRHPVN